jgi:isoquinoline 1-oxidoreductase alpha subunit
MELLVNGRRRSSSSDPERPLLYVLREEFDLTGAKYGCGEGQCGACTVLLDGAPVRSCRTSIRLAQGKQITTIEGLAGSTLHPLQKAWMDVDVAQCGYCQAGQLMSAAALLKQHPNPTDAQIDEAMDGNICRCGTYLRIREAIHQAAAGKGRRSS